MYGQQFNDYDAYNNDGVPWRPNPLEPSRQAPYQPQAHRQPYIQRQPLDVAVDDRSIATVSQYPHWPPNYGAQAPSYNVHEPPSRAAYNNQAYYDDYGNPTTEFNQTGDQRQYLSLQPHSNPQYFDADVLADTRSDGAVLRRSIVSQQHIDNVRAINSLENMDILKPRPPTYQDTFGRGGSPPIQSISHLNKLRTASWVEPGNTAVERFRRSKRYRLRQERPPDDDFVDAGLDTGSLKRRKAAKADPPRQQTAAGDVVPDDGEPEQREQWNNWAEFILSCLGYCVGLGNVWRFPYLVFKNGGGAFLFAYIILMLVAGIPLFLMELTIGQYSGQGPATCWEFCPLFQGLGFGMMLNSFLMSLSYNMIMVWSLYYLFSSFRSTLLWKGCGHEWNSNTCFDLEEYQSCQQQNGSVIAPGIGVTAALDSDTLPTRTLYYQNGKCQERKLYTDREWSAFTQLNRSSPAEDFFQRHMLAQSPSINEPQGLKWDLVGCLFVAWALTFLCVIKGIKSSGKVVYFTALFPFLILIILFFRAVTLENASQGIKFYLEPKFELLMDPYVWGEAAGQVFFSLSVAAGGLMTFGSYNSFTNNVVRDTLIVCLSDAGTAIFAGFVMFSILGFMAGQRGVTVDEVAKSGSGLAFIAYPDVVLYLPPSPLWAILFFFMLLTLGLDSEFAGVECVLTGIQDLFPKLRRRKTLLAFAYCLLAFLLGLPMVSHAGIYVTELINYYVGGWCLVFIALAETIIIGWMYGAHNVVGLIEKMNGMYGDWRDKARRIICIAAWKFVNPVLLLFMLIMAWVSYEPMKYGDYIYPTWANALGWIIAISGVVFLPLVVVFKLCRYEDNAYVITSVWDRVKILTRVSPRWQPQSKVQEQINVALHSGNGHQDENGTNSGGLATMQRAGGQIADVAAAQQQYEGAGHEDVVMYDPRMYSANGSAAQRSNGPPNETIL